MSGDEKSPPPLKGGGRGRRVARWIGGVLLALLLLPIVVVALLLAALNTSAGQRQAEKLLAGVLGPSIVVQGISGSIPSAPRVAHVEIRDAQGAWLTLDDVALDWSPLRLASGIAHAERLSAGHVGVLRLPVSSSTASASSSSGGGFQLPVRVEVEALHVTRADIGEPVAGAPAALALDGRAHLDSLSRGDADATIRRIDGEGTYNLAGRIDDQRIDATVEAGEPAGGLVARLAKLPDLGALDLRAKVTGPWDAAASDVAIVAGKLRATAKGTVNITGQAADLDVTANAPAMTPRPDIHWSAVSLDAHVRGPFTKPAANGTLAVDDLSAAGAALKTLAAKVQGDAGQVALTATIEGLRVPGPKPDLFAAAPVTLTATARLDAPDRPVAFNLAHPLVRADGTAQTGGAMRVAAKLALPDLAPLAAIGGIDLQGHTDLAITAAIDGDTTGAEVTGTVGLTGGMAPVPGLLGPDAKLDLAARLKGSDVTLSRLQVDGRTMRLGATGAYANNVVGLDWTLALADLAVLAPTVSGTLDGRGHVQGPTDNLAATADISGEVATKGFPRGPVKVSLHAQGLPANPAGDVTAEGTLEGAPLRLAAHATRGADGTLDVRIGQAEWKSAQAKGALALAPGAKLPTGKVTLDVGKLADFRSLAGQPLDGRVAVIAELGRDVATLDLRAHNAGLPGTGATSATLTARVADPLGHPSVRAQLAIDGLRAGGTAGTVRLDLAGPEEALGLKLATRLENFQGAPLAADATGTLDVPAERLAVATFTTEWKGETLRLLAPTRVSLAGGLSVERTRLGLRQAVLDIAGKISPRLDLTASLRNVSADLARIAVPDLQADGTLTADARLAGTPARPEGTVRITANGLHLRTGEARALPPANVTANATLAGTAARIDARVAAGANEIAANGTVPLAAGGALSMRANGRVDLAVLDPILTAQGRRVRGRATLDATVTGTTASPRANGTLLLTDGEVQDFAQGARIDAIEARIVADGETVRIARLTGKAGAGTLGATGTVGLRGEMPIDLAVTARRASPLASDRLTASLDADLTLRGAVQGAMNAAGKITINSAEIRVPETLPVTVATLNVRRPGDRPPPPPAPAPPIGLDITLDAPGRIFVRGRGLDAELQGNLRIRGTAAAPRPEGSFKMRRGEFSLAGQTLTFTTGEVGFDGSGKIDPTLNFVANSTNGNIVATLAVTGYASKPKITLSSTPELPQDEVLAQLLFHQSAASLGPFQLAQIAAALAQISGVGGAGGLDPLNSIRSGLGLDRLSVGGGSSGTSPSVEAGRYVANGVYVGAKQGTTGGGTQATVQIDIAKGLKLETDVGSGGSNTGSSASSGSSGTNIGLTYQFEY